MVFKAMPSGAQLGEQKGSWDNYANARLTEREWKLLENILRSFRRPEGRPIDLRSALDGMLYIAWSGESWSKLPAQFGKPDSLRRTFARWSGAGLIDDLVNAVVPTDDTSQECGRGPVKDLYRSLAAKRFSDSDTLHARLIGLTALQARYRRGKRATKSVEFVRTFEARSVGRRYNSPASGA